MTGCRLPVPFRRDNLPRSRYFEVPTAASIPPLRSNPVPMAEPSAPTRALLDQMIAERQLSPTDAESFVRARSQRPSGDGPTGSLRPGS